ncbi:DUF397 domain-containing protein [Streptomyces sp. ID38640]|nr:DUF397 domain-containing protein [Streptomyces sp. ID38640]QIK08834.1 DUF397 domain-containing protein [Streptomyces sp. ID38640]
MEVSDNHPAPAPVPVRDGEVPHGAAAVFPATAWAAFTDAVKDGHFPGA